MEEVSNQGEVYEEAFTQTETASPQMETEQDTKVSPESYQSNIQSQPDQQDKSWIKKVRRDRDDAVRRAHEAERKSKIQEELISQLMTTQQMQVPQEAEEDILSQIEREEYVPGDKVVKALKKQQQDFAKQLDEIKQLHQKQEISKQETQLRSQYSDYDEIVNSDTLDMLKEINPKLFNRVVNLLKVDPMDGASFAYETIVSQGIVDQVPGLKRSKEIEKKLDQNKKTVQSPQAYNKRPMAQAMSYPDTKEAKTALWHETLKYANMGGGGY